MSEPLVALNEMMFASQHSAKPAGVGDGEKSGPPGVTGVSSRSHVSGSTLSHEPVLLSSLENGGMSPASSTKLVLGRERHNPVRAGKRRRFADELVDDRLLLQRHRHGLFRVEQCAVVKMPVTIVPDLRYGRADRRERVGEVRRVDARVVSTRRCS